MHLWGDQGKKLLTPSGGTEKKTSRTYRLMQYLLVGCGKACWELHGLVRGRGHVRGWGWVRLMG